MDGPSICIVVLDTLRKDTFSRYFEWVPGIQFENAYSTSHWTIPAHASMFTGRYASEIGVHGKSRDLDYPGETVIEALQDAGYTTRLWTANMQIFTWDGWERGFDEIYGPNELKPGAEESVSWSEFMNSTDSEGVRKYAEALKYALSADESTIKSVQQGLQQLRSSSEVGGTAEIIERYNDANFGGEELLVLNLMEAHAPHKPPKPYQSYGDVVDFKIGDAFSGKIANPDKNRRAYDDSAAYLSSKYNELFEKVKQDFDVIFTLSDHGELLGEHEMWNHGYGIYPELVRIPLKIWRDNEHGSTDDTVRHDVASILDIPETVSSLADISYESRGKNLLGDMESEERLVEYHGFLPWHRNQLEERGVPNVFRTLDDPLFGLVTEEGKYIYQTHEERNHSPDIALTPDESKRISEFVDSIPKRSVSEEDGEISETVKSQLKDLGYA